MSSNEIDQVQSPSGDPVSPSDRQRMPEVPTRVKRLLADTPSWVNDSEYNESVVFNSLYDEASISYFADVLGTQGQGRQILRVLNKWKPVVEAFMKTVLHNTNSVDDALDANLAWEPEGRGEAIMRPLGVDSFTNAQYQQTPTSTGQFGVVPDADQGNGTQYTMTADEQAAIIIGYMDPHAGELVPYDYIQEDVTDSLGVRRPIRTRTATETQHTMNVIDRHRGPLPVMPGDSVDIDAHITETDIRTGLFPVGFEAVIATSGNYGGVLD